MASNGADLCLRGRTWHGRRNDVTVARSRGGSAVWLRTRSVLRNRRRATAGLMFIVAVASGSAMAAAAGARRTGTAYDRFLGAAHADDAQVGFVKVGADPRLDDVERLPEVADHTRRGYAFVVPVDPSGRPDPLIAGQPLVSQDDAWLDRIDR